jgi:hypothetical protein
LIGRAPSAPHAARHPTHNAPIFNQNILRFSDVTCVSRLQDASQALESLSPLALSAAAAHSEAALTAAYFFRMQHDVLVIKGGAPSTLQPSL